MLSALLVASFLVATQESAAPPPPPTPRPPLLEGYLDSATLDSRLRALITEFPALAREVTVGTTREGRAIRGIMLGPEAPAPTLLVVAGLDGTHLLGSEIAVRLAERLARAEGTSLAASRLLVIPRLNLDAVERTWAAPGAPQSRAPRPVDDDRDAAVDEDPPNDLNGDGLITLMRQANPPPPDEATHLASPDDPRVLRTPDAAKGERAIYRVMIEGIDDDADGLLNEDALGGIDLDRNFMHRWPEHGDGAGTHPLSEPESQALARLVLAHPEIVACVVFGRHDNLVNAPDSRGRDVNPRVPLELDPTDQAMHAEIARIYKEQTGQTRAATTDSAGSFASWMYAQRGVPSFAAAVWGRPDAPAPPAATEGAAPAAPTPETAAPTPPPPPPPPGEAPADPSRPAGSGDPAASAPPAEAPRPRRGPRGQRPSGPATETQRPPAGAASSDDAGWLAYSDASRGGAGFVAWTPFDHPTLGAVEIGGFAPLFQVNPPSSELDALAEKQTAFVIELLARLPVVELAPPRVERLAEGLFRIRTSLRNTGRLPLGTGYARANSSGEPIVVRLSTPVERITAGRRIERVRGIAPGVGQNFEWLVRTEPGEDVTITVRVPGLPEQVLAVPLEASAPDAAPREAPQRTTALPSSASPTSALKETLS